MKKIVVLMLVLLVMVCGFCGCSGSQDKEPIGYVIIPHFDGGERVEITSYWITSGVLNVETVDGDHIVSNTLVVIEY